MSNGEKDFEVDFYRALNEIKELRQMVEALRAELAAHERRELLRVRGVQYCRICLVGTANPRISEAEQKYHDANHATGSHADPSRRLAGHPATVDWDQLERQLADSEKARGEGW